MKKFIKKTITMMLIMVSIFSTMAVNSFALDFSTPAEEAWVKNHLTKVYNMIPDDKKQDKAYVVEYMTSYVAQYPYYGDSEKNSQGVSVYSAKAIFTGGGVCQSYADTMKIAFDIAKIENKFVKNNIHGWNAVKINGKWYFVDATGQESFQGQKKSTPLFIMFGQEYANELISTGNPVVQYQKGNFDLNKLSKENYYAKGIVFDMSKFDFPKVSN